LEFLEAFVEVANKKIMQLRDCSGAAISPRGGTATSLQGDFHAGLAGRGAEQGLGVDPRAPVATGPTAAALGPSLDSGGAPPRPCCAPASCHEGAVGPAPGLTPKSLTAQDTPTPAGSAEEAILAVPAAQRNGCGPEGRDAGRRPPEPERAVGAAAARRGREWPRVETHAAASSAAALAAALQSQRVTTLMVRNLPHSVTQKRLVEELAASGFAGLYDFCYMPSMFGTGVGKGYAFVNLTSAAALGAFVSAWHGSRRFGISPSEASLNVSAAAMQGLQENVRKWDAPRMRRVRNPALRPLVMGGPGAEAEGPAAPGAPSAEPAAAAAPWPQMLPSAPPGLVPAAVKDPPI